MTTQIYAVTWHHQLPKSSIIATSTVVGNRYDCERLCKIIRTHKLVKRVELRVVATWDIIEIWERAIFTPAKK